MVEGFVGVNKHRHGRGAAKQREVVGHPRQVSTVQMTREFRIGTAPLKLNTWMLVAGGRLPFLRNDRLRDAAMTVVGEGQTHRALEISHAAG